MATRILPFITLVFIVLALVMIQNGHCAVTVPGGAAITLPGGVTLPGKVTLPGGVVVTVPVGGVVSGGAVVTQPGGGVVPGGGATGTGTTSKSGHNAAIISRSSFSVLVGAVALAVLAS